MARFAGKLHTWHQDRGFGFIRPSDGGQDIFVHVSALPAPRPDPDEVLTFELGLNADGKKKAMDVRRERVEVAGLAADVERVRSPYRSVSRGGGGKLLQGVIVLLILGALVAYGYRQYQKSTPWGIVSTPAPAPVRAQSSVAPVANSFQCDGRKHCSQMTSCAEANFFLRNCPGTKMDGDGDGKPCERGPC